MPETATIVVESIEEKSGEKDGRKWTKYAIKDANGEFFSTFDGGVIAPAKDLIGKRAEVDYEVSGKFKNLAAVRAAETNGGAADYVKAKENPSTQRSISAAVALQQAVATLTPKLVAEEAVQPGQVADKVLTLASRYFAWLLQRTGLETDEDIPF